MNDVQPTPKGINPWWIVGLVCVGGWLVYVLYFLPIPVANTEGPPTDLTWPLRDLKGGEIRLDQYRGKPIFLNVWATWCPPCVKEMPSIAHLAGRPELEGVVFLCVSVDESDEEVKNFIAAKRWPMTFARATEVPRAFATRGIPATFIIGPSGRLAYSDVGSRDWDDFDTIGLLKQLLSEVRSEPSPPATAAKPETVGTH